MSVVKSEQGESRVQFLETARNLYKAVMSLCVKLPKRYTFYIGRSVYESARDGYRHVKAANAIYPTNQHEALTRARRKLRIFRDWVSRGKMSFMDVVHSMASWRGCIRRSRGYFAIRRVIDYFKLLFKEEISQCLKLPKVVL